MSGLIPRGEPSRVPHTFRRESRLFLWVALLLILFLNFLTLLFFRNAVAWGSQEAQRRAELLLHRVALTSGRADGAEEAMELSALEPDVSALAIYNARGQRLRVSGPGAPDTPLILPDPRPAPGHIRHDWDTNPTLLIATLATGQRYFMVAVDPGPGVALRSYARKFSIFVPLAGVVLIVLAAFYLRSLLAPYERLLAAAGGAPATSREQGDERNFLIARFESTIAALHEKERELEQLARRQKERADDLETAARTSLATFRRACSRWIRAGA